MNSIDERLKEMIAGITKIKGDASEISEETDFIKDLGYDSVQIVKLIVATEQEFEFEFEDEYLSIELIGTYKALKSYIESKMAVGA